MTESWVPPKALQEQKSANSPAGRSIEGSQRPSVFQRLGKRIQLEGAEPQQAHSTKNEEKQEKTKEPVQVVDYQVCTSQVAAMPPEKKAQPQGPPESPPEERAVPKNDSKRRKMCCGHGHKSVYFPVFSFVFPSLVFLFGSRFC